MYETLVMKAGDATDEIKSNRTAQMNETFIHIQIVFGAKVEQVKSVI